MNKIILAGLLIFSCSIVKAENQTNVPVTARYQLIQVAGRNFLRIDLQTGRVWELARYIIKKDGEDQEYGWWNEILEQNEIVNLAKRIGNKN